MKILGIAIVIVVVIAVVVLGIYCYFSNGNKGKRVKKAVKNNLPKTKVDGDVVKVRIVVDEQVTVFNYDTKAKKLTVKGKETTIANGIKAILAADDTVFFIVKETGKAYQLTKAGKIVEVFSENDEDDDFDDWD